MSGPKILDVQRETIESILRTLGKTLENLRGFQAETERLIETLTERTSESQEAGIALFREWLATLGHLQAEFYHLLSEQALQLQSAWSRLAFPKGPEAAASRQEQAAASEPKVPPGVARTAKSPESPQARKRSASASGGKQSSSGKQTSTGRASREAVSKERAASRSSTNKDTSAGRKQRAAKSRSSRSSASKEAKQAATKG